jgi:hypothetical protein
MNKNSIKSALAFFGLLLVVLFPRPLSAQSNSNASGYDYDGRAIVTILPFIGEEEAAAVFDQAVAGAVVNLKKYSSRQVTPETVSEAGVRIPTDMPPIRELALGARYALTGGVYPGSFDGEYYLQLWLWDMSGSTMIYTDDLVYQDIAEALETLPGLVEWLFSHIIEITKESESVPEEVWEDKLITVGFRSGVSQRWYTEPAETAAGAYALNFEGGLFVSVLLNSLLSLQAEVNFTMDDLVYRGITNIGQGGAYIPVTANEKYSSYSLMFPLLFKVNFKPGQFRLAPFAGIYAFLPLGETSYRMNPGGETDSFSWSADLPLGFTVGFDTAIKFGPGMILADVRYANDFGTITIHDDVDTSYKRTMFSVTLGYAFGFIDFKK